MHRRLIALLLAVAVSVLMLFAVAGSSRLSGPVVIGLGGTHGIHRDDLIALAGWLVALWCAWRMSRDG